MQVNGPGGQPIRKTGSSEAQQGSAASKGEMKGRAVTDLTAQKTDGSFADISSSNASEGKPLEQRVTSDEMSSMEAETAFCNEVNTVIVEAFKSLGQIEETIKGEGDIDVADITKQLETIKGRIEMSKASLESRSGDLKKGRLPGDDVGNMAEAHKQFNKMAKGFIGILTNKLDSIDQKLTERVSSALDNMFNSGFSVGVSPDDVMSELGWYDSAMSEVIMPDEASEAPKVEESQSGQVSTDAVSGAQVEEYDWTTPDISDKDNIDIGFIQDAKDAQAAKKAENVNRAKNIIKAIGICLSLITGFAALVLLGISMVRAHQRQDAFPEQNW